MSQDVCSIDLTVMSSIMYFVLSAISLISLCSLCRFKTISIRGIWPINIIICVYLYVTKAHYIVQVCRSLISVLSYYGSILLYCQYVILLCVPLSHGLFCNSTFCIIWFCTICPPPQYECKNIDLAKKMHLPSFCIMNNHDCLYGCWCLLNYYLRQLWWFERPDTCT